jgi:ATP-dependent Clp endopeptidase proteolytic subunit ClpP
MPKIWTIRPGSFQAQSGRVAEVLFYKHISEYGMLNAATFNAELRKLEREYDEMRLRIHSPGGSIFEGVAMYHAMQASTLKITTCVDGLAASMASAILQGGEHRQMGRFARIMIHQGSGSVGGSANQIKNYAELLETLNNDLTEIYAQATGKSTEWIKKNWMAEGKDTWINAEQAKKNNLIDEIVDAKVKIKPDEKAMSNVVEMVAHYDAAIQAIGFDNQVASGLQAVALHLGLSAEATEEEILNVLKQQTKDSAKRINQLVIDSLIKKGVIPTSKQSAFQRLALYDFDAALDMLDPVISQVGNTQVRPINHISISDTLRSMKYSGVSSMNSVKSDWTLRDYEKKDPDALSDILNNRPEEYQRLFKAQYGKEISLDEIKIFAWKFSKRGKA